MTMVLLTTSSPRGRFSKMRKPLSQSVTSWASVVLFCVGLFMLASAWWFAQPDLRLGLHPKESIDASVYAAFLIIVALVLRMSSKPGNS
jgi:hypothetical protein